MKRRRAHGHGLLHECPEVRLEYMRRLARERLENFGLDETFWKVIQKAPAEKFGDAEFVTKNSILNISDADLATLGISRHALEKYASDYLAFVFDDAHMASLQPISTRERPLIGA